jgi:hypothetical protein
MMTLAEAQRYLKSRTEVAFDRMSGPGRHQISWSVADAHAVRLVLFELARLQRLERV